MPLEMDWFVGDGSVASSAHGTSKNGAVTAKITINFTFQIGIL